ncbi:MAG: hypothetical protein KIT65_17295, partial [Xanthobacteraceae bacterium]|nr:hypothetical protein [Xanthobacteraceae bacterium]
MPITIAAVAMGASLAPAQPACEATRIVSPPETPPSRFGDRVATNGRQWIISDANARTLCPGDPFHCSAGAVHSYEMIDGQLVHRQTLTPPSPRLGDFYGISLDIHENRLIVGTLNYTWPDNPRKGGAFVYEYNGEQWVEVGQIQKPDIDPAFLNHMGITAKMHDGLALLPAGSVRSVVLSYRETTEGWAFHELIESPDGLPVDALFGHFLAMGGPWVFLSAFRDSSLVPNGGSVYVYRREADNTLTFVEKLVSPDAPTQAFTGFGLGIAFDGQTLAVGAPGVDRDVQNQGVVYTFEFDGHSWVQRQELVLKDPERMEQFGQWMSMGGGVLLAMSTRDIPRITHDSPYAFRRGADGRWRELGLLVPNPPFFAPDYGIRTTTDGRHVLVGSSQDVEPDGITTFGAAYLFDLTCFDCQADFDYDGQLTIFDFL